MMEEVRVDASQSSKPRKTNRGVQGVVRWLRKVPQNLWKDDAELTRQRGARVRGGTPDDPIAGREADLLDRWRVAEPISSLIRNSATDWTVRIGVFGRWGEGKTSIFALVEQSLDPVQFRAAHFSPWSARDAAEL